MAHELGHVIQAWHIGDVACIPVQADFDAAPLGPAPSNGLLSASRINEQEAEANRFASSLLVPRRFFEELAEESMSDAISALNCAEVSAIAAILALAKSLLPGFWFLVDEDEDGFRDVISSGTQEPAGGPRKSRVAKLRDGSYDFGETFVSNRRILWFQLAAQTEFAIPDDARGTTEILRSALMQSGDDSARTRLSRTINGVVGGMLSKGERAQTASQALAVLEHRFSSDPKLQYLLEIPDFRLYLKRKAADRASRCSSLATISGDPNNQNRPSELRSSGGRCRALRRGLPSLTCGGRSFRELEHVGALGVLGALSAFLGWQHAIRVYLLLESLEERFSRGARAGGAVVRASPRDFRCDAPVNVLGRVASPPFMVAMHSRGGRSSRTC
jgi:hypothetical protein